jgi:hypothetical protein
VRARSSRRAAALLALGATLAAAGCGSGAGSTSADLRLQREDLIATARALSQARPEAASEVGATKAAWPLVANGLPAGGAGRARIAAATRKARALRLPSLFTEQRAAGLTGPGSSLAGTYRAYVGLAGTGWTMIEHALGVSDTGGAGASFARTNSPLYIESVYDGHFGLAQIGKNLLAGYQKLGGQAAFGKALTGAEVARLGAAYSEPAVRLHPHPGVKLGS